MKTIFLFLCHLQPLPPIPGQLLWKLHQPRSNKDKDGVRECGKMEARQSCITNLQSDIQQICSTISAFLFWSHVGKRWIFITNVPIWHVQLRPALPYCLFVVLVHKHMMQYKLLLYQGCLKKKMLHYELTTLDKILTFTP